TANCSVQRHDRCRARTTSTETPRNDTAISIGHFQTPSLTASSTHWRGGSPPSTGVPLPPRRASSTRSHCRPATGSSLPSLLLRLALTWPEAQQRIQNVLQRGLQRDSDFETRWPEVLGTLLEA